MDGVLLNQPKAKPLLLPFKFEVKAIMLATDRASGSTVGEVAAAPTVLYGVDALKEWAENFTAELERMQEAS